MFERFLLNLKFGLRGFRRRPGFTLAAVITLGLCIGLNVAIFGILDRVLLRPLPFPHSERLVWITNSVPELDMQLVTGSTFLQWRHSAATFDEIAAFRPNENYNLTWPGEPSRIRAARVSANFLETLGVSVAQGREFKDKEDSPGHNLVAIVTRRFFEQRFGLRTSFSGQSVGLDGTPYTIVGVLPPGFRVPDHPDIDILLPLALNIAQEESGEQNTIVETIGRLKRGATLSEAQANLETIQDSTAAGRESRPEVILLREHFDRRYQRTLVMLQCAAGLILLIGCVNLANLLLSGLLTRQREFAIRNALGASAGRIVEQVLTESWLLSVFGGGLGLLLSIGGIVIFDRLAPSGVARLLASLPNAGLSPRLLAVTFFLMLLAACLIGMVPVLSMRRSNWIESLRESAQSGRGWRQKQVRRYLIACEMALALVLANEGGLLLKSLYRLVEVNPGFRPQNVLTFDLQLSPNKYVKDADRVGFCESLSEKLGAVPGVESVGLSDSLPLSGNATELYALVGEGASRTAPKQNESIDLIYASPGYFKAMGIPLIRGRVFTDSDRARVAVIVSAGLARHFWGSEDVVGKRIKKGPLAPWASIVGVVGDVHRNGLDATSTLTIYQPWFESDLEGIINVSIRSGMKPSIMLRESRAAVRSLDNEIPRSSRIRQPSLGSPLAP